MRKTIVIGVIAILFVAGLTFTRSGHAMLAQFGLVTACDGGSCN